VVERDDEYCYWWCEEEIYSDLVAAEVAPHELLAIGRSGGCALRCALRLLASVDAPRMHSLAVQLGRWGKNQDDPFVYEVLEPLGQIREVE
jgi:hypothetical protein